MSSTGNSLVEYSIHSLQKMLVKPVIEGWISTLKRTTNYIVAFNYDGNRLTKESYPLLMLTPNLLSSILGQCTKRQEAHQYLNR